MANGTYGHCIDFVWVDEFADLSRTIVDNKSLISLTYVDRMCNINRHFSKSVESFKKLVDKEVQGKLKELNRRYNLAKVKRDKVLMTDLEKQIVALRTRISS